jgi:hypothetical protein
MIGTFGPDAASDFYRVTRSMMPSQPMPGRVALQVGITVRAGLPAVIVCEVLEGVAQQLRREAQQIDSAIDREVEAHGGVGNAGPRGEA